jgi:nitrogen fixation/metabolism regulation signal transduction histidine kinase
MIIADYLKLIRRLLKLLSLVIAIPLFVIAFVLTIVFSTSMEIFFLGKSKYQIALWIGTVYLYQRKPQYYCHVCKVFS